MKLERTHDDRNEAAAAPPPGVAAATGAPDADGRRPAAAAEPPSADRKTLHRVVAAAAMGNAMEWFDYGIYGYLAAYVGQAFFPSGDDTARLLSTFGVLAVSFAIRPFGGLFFGPLGDRIGRQRVLVLTLAIMSLSTFAIGILPTYASIGVWSPVLLVVARLAQGFSTGGEYGGAATFMAEYAPDRRRGFYGSFLEFGTLIGLTSGALLATLMSSLAGDSTVAAWGWRVPFLVALPLGAVGMYLRSRLEDTPVFEELLARGERASVPLRATLAHWRPILTLMAFVLVMNVTDYGILTYMPTYLKNVLGLSGVAGNAIPMLVMVAMMAVIIPIGALSDRIGRKPIVVGACAGILVLSVPVIALIGTGSTVAVVVGVAVFGMLLVMLLASVASCLPALFPTHVRYSAFAIGYNVVSSAFGGTTPLIVTALISATGDDLVPGYYMALAALVALVPLIRMPETKGMSLRGPRSGAGGGTGAGAGSDAAADARIAASTATAS